MSKALVLSGGGPLAVAWECGVLSGLAQSGLALSSADFILGTSAGAIVGAQIASGRDPTMMAKTLIAESNNALGKGGGSSYPPEAVAKLQELFAKSQTGETGRVEVGAYALAASTPDSPAAYIERMTSIVGFDAWPEKIGLAVVDIADGKPRVLRRDCRATLGTGVAASCCLPGFHPPVLINGKHYMDGGLRSPANADLVGRFDVILVLSFNLPGPIGQRMISRVKAQVDELTASGAQVSVTTPDEACLEAIGPNTMDFARRPEVARQAIAQGIAIADFLAKVWL
ncbi:patatin-like phospholipase family protein [Agrobacterium rhizogenes]|nr:patatin-like phospholipase family protein [Rhizobium rhizogenes]NTH38175.1 patatin-like phospholipase family protein [Rhizobium rhizogenes]NTJ00605.1 patatin-like phospholipase family protein [Rhizobium rhizogenes]